MIRVLRIVNELFSIIHEDADILVVHKPADLVCHPTKGDEYSSLISRVRIYLLGAGYEAQGARPALAPIASSLEPRLVNRLDRETSGLVVIAKNSEAVRELGKIWETRSVTKEYSAIVHGHVAAEQGMIDAPLGKDEASVVAIKDCVRADGTPSQTEFFVERRFVRSAPLTPSLSPSNGERMSVMMGEGNFTLLRVVPLSGRKHQIRIHLAHIGHPIVGDKIYGGDADLYLALVERRLTDEQRSRLMLTTHALHAGRLMFNWRGRDFDFATPPEPAFLNFLNGE
jgi:23S rRNA pseudouridine1911/1915/1917 synthase